MTKTKQRAVTPKGSKAVLFTGLALSFAAFCCAVVPLAMFLIPGGVGRSSTPFVTVGVILNAVAVGLSFTGIIMSAGSALHNRTAARFSFLFGMIGFTLGVALLILCVVFGIVLPFGSL